MKFNRMILNGTKFRSITFILRKKNVMLASGWSLTKGDWWYEDNPENRKFWSVDWEPSEDRFYCGVYIGRFGLRLMTTNS